MAWIVGETFVIISPKIDYCMNTIMSRGLKSQIFREEVGQLECVCFERLPNI